ncbi:hypothetical protein HJFPF1_13468 [Paramyrothecium foliicola]|nr:hypothetical protein HJFPF1_13468 [Paramyrothecium foliicola]
MAAFTLLWDKLLLGGLNLALYSLILVLIQATYVAERRSKEGLDISPFLRPKASTTIAAVQASQVMLLALTNLCLGDAFEALCWIMMRRPGGFTYLSFLGLSPSTGYLGSLRLAFTVPWSLVPLMTRLWALLKVVLKGGAWLSGLVLFINTSSPMVYDHGYSYNITAGVGPFNSSLVRPFINFTQSLAPPDSEETVLPQTYLSTVNMLVMSPVITMSAPQARGATQDDDGTSYLMVGGLESVTPWVPETYHEYGQVRLDKVPSIQLNFNLSTNTTFSDGDCDTFGQDGISIGMRLCVSNDPSRPASIRSGLFICPNGTNSDSCHPPEGNLPNVTLTASFSARQATVVATRSNYSIVSLLDASEVEPFLWSSSDMQAYREVFRWLLDYHAAGIPAPSSIVEFFWTASNQLSSKSTAGLIAHNFHSLLAFPFWLFNVNNWGNIDTRQNETITGLPPQYYTKASLGQAIVFIWVVLVWTVIIWTKQSPPTISEFSMFDIAFKTKIKGPIRGEPQNALPQAGTGQAIQNLQGYTIRTR